jgi:VanZ family protein
LFAAKYTRHFWHAVGWFGIALLLYLSLTPRPPEISIEQGDKLGHTLAYAVLMYWWSQLHVAVRQRVLLAAGLMALGVAIEYVQGWTGWRTFDSMDMIADAAGVILGGMMAALTPNLLVLVGDSEKRSD